MQKNDFIERVATWPRLPLTLTVVGLVVVASVVILAVTAPWKSAYND
jgi:hypothetical protein